MLEISFLPKEGRNRDCKSSKETVLSYIKASDEARGEFSSKDVIGSFGHIYWCWAKECATIWRTLKFHNVEAMQHAIDKDLIKDPVFCERINEEIQELLARWQNEDPGVVITPLIPDPSVLKKDLLN